MGKLEQHLKKLAKGKTARWWLGPLPDVRVGKVAKSIAAALNYPSGEFDPFAESEMIRLDRPDAAYVLALAGTRSLAHGNKPPSSSTIQQTMDALTELTDKAVFLSNGNWTNPTNRSWIPLSSATFDCGIIGFDEMTAFIFWIEEED